jgi:hypothetical protein
MALEIFALQVLLAFAITAFGVMAAARIKQMQSFMAPTQMLVTPMFFWRVPTLVEAAWSRCWDSSCWGSRCGSSAAPSEARSRSP